MPASTRAPYLEKPKSPERELRVEALDWVMLTKKIPGAVIKNESKPSAMGRSWRGGTTEQVIDGDRWRLI